MTGFLIVAALILLSVLAYLLRPLLAPQLARAAEESPAISVLREQRRDLEKDFAAARISQAEYSETLEELTRRTAAEMAPLAALSKQRPARIWALGVALALPASAIAVYLIIGQPAGLDPVNTAAPQAIGPAEIAAMVDKLAAKVKANPDDLEGLQMLARSYMVLERFSEAADAFARLAERQPKDAQALADWADALGSAQGNSMTGEPAQLIARALTLDPDNVKALALGGTIAFERGDYREALQLWERMAARVDPQSEIGRNAQAMLDEARKRSGQASPRADGATGLQLTGQIRLASALRNQVGPDDVLFVFARPAAGGPPVAALRYRAADLPLDFDFARAQLMTQSVGDGPFIIGARISKSGDPMARPGDFQGASDAVPANSKGIVVEISKTVE